MKVGEWLNNVFFKVIVKNLDLAEKRLENFDRSAKSVNLEYEIYRAINGMKYIPDNINFKNVFWDYKGFDAQYLLGNHISHIGIILHAMSNQFESYVSCDDDCEFSEVEIENISHLPNDWDLIILGGFVTHSASTVDQINFSKINSANEIAGSHCSAVNKNFYYKWFIKACEFVNDIQGKQREVGGFVGDTLIHHMWVNNDINVYRTNISLVGQNRTSLIPYTIA